MPREPVRLTEIAQAIADAQALVDLGLGMREEPPQVRAELFRLVVRELLDFEVDRNLPADWRPEAVTTTRRPS